VGGNILKKRSLKQNFKLKSEEKGRIRNKNTAEERGTKGKEMRDGQGEEGMEALMEG
jgi:hypothetical protein